MELPSHEHRRATLRLDRAAIEAHQLARLNELLATILPANPLYAHKLAGRPAHLESLHQLAELPFTTKDDLLPGRADGDNLPTNHTFRPQDYVRYHQTSGTRGRPMMVLDTADDWRWWIGCWQYVLDAADVRPDDRVMMAFSFGPFIGFWSAYDAVVARGAMAIPGGGLGSLARLELMRTTGATVLCCTPTYALRLAEVAAEQAFPLSELDVRTILVAGEPGGSVPAMRERMESAFAAHVVDHAGASEVGPWGFADAARKGLQILEIEFIAEFLSTETGAPAASGELAHLVLTSLGRYGAPVIRYRTGDLVRPIWPADGPCRFVLLEGGVLGRADDMMIIRGMNVFPSAVEQILHGFPEVAEYRMTARKDREMDTLLVEVEDRMESPERIAKELHLRLGLSIEVRCVSVGTLPRYDGKGRRFADER